MTAEIAALQERQYNAHRQLEAYRSADEFAVPVGGLSPQYYERILEAWEDVQPVSEQAYELGWVRLEWAMAIARSDINYATEEPYTAKEKTAAFEQTRHYLQRVASDANASRLLRSQARIAQSSIPQHQELLAGKGLITSASRYVGYLKTIRAVAADFIDQADLSEEEERFVHTITVASNLTAHAYRQLWFLPAPPRQSWDITAYSSDPKIHDIFITLGAPSDDPRIVTVHPTVLGTPEDKFATMRNYLQVEPPDYEPTGGRVVHGSKSVFNTIQRRYDFYTKTRDVAKQLNRSLQGAQMQQNKLGLPLREPQIKENTKEKSIERDICDAAVWYLAEFDGETIDARFMEHYNMLNNLRRFEGILPHERVVLAWMQLDYARAMALEAGNEEGKLGRARLQFGTAIDFFEGAERQFKRKRLQGEAYDAALAAQVAAVERGLYTSTDLYALRRIIKDYHLGAANIFLKVKDITGPPEQVAASRHSLSRATLSLLMAAADAEMQHLILATSPRVRHDKIAVGFQVLYEPKVSGYELAAPIAIQLVDGNDIVAGERRVEVGRDALILHGDPLALLRQLSVLHTSGNVGKGKRTKTTPVRNADVQELSERLAYAISDAGA